jgi:hypothetical protein
MKTDVDLLTEFHSWFFPAAVGDAIKGSLIFHEWKKQWLPKMNGKPQMLTDTEFAAKLEVLKNEAPGYLHYLRSTSFPELPPELHPFPKN